MFPDEFQERLKDIVPDKIYDNVFASMCVPKGTTFRVNTLKSSRDEVVDGLSSEEIEFREIGWIPSVYWVSHEHRDLLLESDLFSQNKIYIQNLSSMIPPLVLAPRSGERILDLTAAPGSKTLQIACMTDQVGEIAAVEVVKSRFFKLKSNLESQGADKVRVFLKDGCSVWYNRPEYFDKVLLDAPCSSEGRFHAQEPESYKYWSPRKIKEMARKQKQLVYSAVQCLKPGGTLVYSTCSFAPEENEAILNGMLKKFADSLTIEPVDQYQENFLNGMTEWKGKQFNDAVKKAKRILPTYLMDGFFVSKIRKDKSTLPHDKLKRRTYK